MPDRQFTLHQMYQRLDESLRRERQAPRPDALTLLTLQSMKRRVKALLRRLMPVPQFAG